MAADFYKQLIFVGFLSIFLTTVDSDCQSLTLTNVTSTLHEISFNISTSFNVNSTSLKVNVNVTDAYTSVQTKHSLSENDNGYFVKVTNLSSGSLFTVKVDSNNETCVQNVSTRPGGVTNLKAINILFTSAKIIWDIYVPPQGKNKPNYQISFKKNTSLEENNSKIFSKLSPATEYQFYISVKLYELSGKTTNITFSTPPVLPPNVTIVAVNTSALNVTWPINQTNSIDPEYVNVYSENVTSKCPYSARFCVIKIGQKPGKNHKLSLFSSYKNVSSQRANFSHHTKPLPPNCYEHSNSTSLTVYCTPQESDFDLYLIYFFINNTIISQNISREDHNVSISFPNLQFNTGYKVIFGSLSGTERSENSSKMFYTNPSLEQVNIRVAGNSVFVYWIQPDFDNCSMCLYNNISNCKVISGNNVRFDVRAGMKYYLNVSCNAKWSNSRPVIVPPLPPTHLKIRLLTTDSVVLNWDFNYNDSAVDDWFISIGGYTLKILPNKTESKIQNLTSGTNYTISIWSFAAGKNSSIKKTSIKTYPECITTLSKVSFTNSSISLNVAKTNNSFDRYEFVLLDQNGNEKKANVSKNTTPANFSSLEAGMKYEISVKTVSGNLSSESCKSTITARTKPNPPIVVCQPSERKIHVKLTKGHGYIDGFVVDCTKCTNLTTKNFPSNESTSWDFSDLQPNEMYFIMVKTSAGNLTSETVTCNSTTNESAPSEVQELKAEEVHKNTVNLTWKKPDQSNGIIRWYLVEGVGKQKGSNETHDVHFNSSKEFYQLTVKPGYMYQITVKAFTVKKDPGKNINFTSKTYAPGFKPNLANYKKQPNKSKIGQRSFTVEFPQNPFTEENGRILNYTVIVATSNERDETGSSVLPNWYQFNKNRSINAYQVISNCTHLYEPNNICNKKTTIAGRTKRSTEIQSVKFKIGVDDCSKENTAYCNGYLEVGKKYYVKVRAYTQDAFKDTPFSEAIRTESEKVSSSPNYIIALAVICPLVTLLLAGLAFYLVRKRRLPKTSKVEKDTGNVTMQRIKPTSHPVHLNKFKAHVSHMSSDSGFLFAEEYKHLKEVGKNQEFVTAQLMCNRNKNRFANISPYAHSRVKLSSVDDKEGSVYVNANYLPGYNSHRQYIVTQGPHCSTRDDFWRMISEQNVHNIVMLTKLRDKCDQYWPVTGYPIFYGDVQVAKLHETIKPDWTITKFKITSTEKSWNLLHYHFTSWPDFGVPNSPQVLVNFVQTVRSSLIDKGPIVVHCSAGVGHSGTFIAVDHCMQHIQTNDSVDVLGVVYEMRMNQGLMVQTEQQYIYIHHCLLNALEAYENEDIYQDIYD